MQRIVFTLLLGLLAIPVAAQPQTLFSGDVRHGGFGSPVLRVSTLDNRAALYVGGRGGWILNFGSEHSLTIGGGGYGLVTDHRLPEDILGAERFLVFGYGGPELGYVNRTNQVVHFSVQALIGAGGVMHRTGHWYGWDGPQYGERANTVFVAEPGVDLEVNVTRFMRMTVGGSYRFVSGSRTVGVTDGHLSGASGVFAVKFGSF
jgi:hypothetical protein